MINKHFIIIGAGLSGLTAAYVTESEYGIRPLVLEARNRIGGRIETADAIELGATWLGGEHKNLIELLHELNIDTYPQYQQGKGIFIHSAADPPHYFEAAKNSNPTFRISGGSGNLIQTLRTQARANVHLNQSVQEIRDKSEFLEVITGESVFNAQKVICTIPPQLAATAITFSPTLPARLSEQMLKTQTWMSNAIKIGMKFESPFWRKANLSGTLVAPNSPVLELYDHCDRGGNSYALTGFANEALREHPPNKRKNMIINFLTEYFGDEINDYTSYHEKDWLNEDYTATPQAKSIYMHPNYGEPVWEQAYMNGRLLFSGSETSPNFGGYMEGAVAAGKKAAAFIADYKSV